MASSKITPQSSSSSASSSSTPNPTTRWNHDVFLSFRGEDTRYNFTDYLYKALIQKGILTFRDDDELRRGEDIATELLKAINGSRIAVIIFSENYANSRWCLDELAEIMKCRQEKGQLVLPVFCNVDPEDVKTQSGSFRTAFVGHEERFAGDVQKLQNWRNVLTEAASLSGFNSQDFSAGHATFIQSIVEEVFTILNQMHLNIAVYPVGIDSRVKDLHFLLNVGPYNVRIIGIHGMGGIGKTAMTKAIYNEVFHKFEGSSFLANVREASQQPNGLVHLQEQLLSDVLMNRNLTIDIVDRGITLIKERLCCKRVLIVLDDVDQDSQLNALASMRDWFGPGSRIIITTRNVELLNKFGVDEKYEVEELNPEQSLELFSKHAFRKDKPAKEYEELSNGVVRYAGGLPLALEVLGSFLYDKKSISEWQCALEKFKVHPHSQLKNRLLYDVKEIMDIFLDIACFFIGVDKDYAMIILDGCHSNLEAGIGALTRRSLVTINENNEFRMRDLLQDMGREIVREKSPKEPGKRSRLWSHDVAYDVLTRDMGTEEVEGLILDNPDSREAQLSAKAFAKMSKLKLLQLNNVQLTGSYEHFSEELRWLCWRGFPLKCIPTEFRLDNLVVLDMQYGSLKQVWKETKFLRRLKILNLGHSYHLTRTPDFSGLPSLEKLMLEGCTSLFEVHQSIGHLNRLVLLNLKDCKNLKNLPNSIAKLKALGSLILTGCSKLDKLPENLGDMDSLTELSADESAIEKLPSSIGLLKNLRSLCLRGCKGSPSKSLLSSLWPSWGSRRSPDSITLLPPSIQGLFGRGMKLDIFFRGYEVPDWFTHQCQGSSISFELPPSCSHKILGLTLCAVYAANKEADMLTPLFDGDKHTSPPAAKINVGRNGDEAYYYPNVKDIPITHQDHVWMCHVPWTEFGNQLESGVQIEVSVEIGEPLKVKKCGIHLQCQETNGKVPQPSKGKAIQYAGVVDGGRSAVAKLNTKTKRGRNDIEAGPSNATPDKNQETRRLRTELGRIMY